VAATANILQDAHARALEKWGGRVDLPAAGFERHVTRVQADGARLDAYGADLFLVAAVLEGVPNALAFFDGVLAAACTVAARIDAAPEFIDDVRQELRLKLLTGPEPKLRSYVGAGGLADWLRVAALRAAINLKRSDRLVATEQLPVESMLSDADAVPIKEWYRADFQRALEAGFQRLSARDRTLLRLHFVDGLNIERVGVMYGVHRATVARWLVGIKQRLFEQAKAELVDRHGLDTRDVKSLYRLLEREVHITISRILRP
jgi:RNA polymerase sigma-70 factor (ECF subfamily)